MALMRMLDNFFNPRAQTASMPDPLFDQARYDNFLSVRGDRRSDIESLGQEFGNYGDIAGTAFTDDMASGRSYLDSAGSISGRLGGLSRRVEGLSDIYEGFRKEASGARDLYSGLGQELEALQGTIGGANQDPRASLEFQMASDAINKNADDSVNRLNRVMQERGIDPSSPAAISMLADIETNRRSSSRQARGQVIMDLRDRRQRERSEQAGFIGARGDMASRGLEATGMGANLTSQQIQSLVNSGSMTAQEANLLLQNAGQRQQLAGLNLNREMYMRSGERDMALELLQGAEADVEKEWQNKLTDATLRAQVNMFNQRQRQQATNQGTQNLLSAVKIGAGVAMGNPAVAASGVASATQQTPTYQPSDILSQPLPRMAQRNIGAELQAEQEYLSRYRPDYNRYMSGNPTPAMTRLAQTYNFR